MGVVEGAVGVDAIGAFLARLRFRFGISRSLSALLGTGVPGTMSAVVVLTVGKNSLLPGLVVYVRPDGVVHTMVPSGYCTSDQPGRKVFIRW